MPLHWKVHLLGMGATLVLILWARAFWAAKEGWAPRIDAEAVFYAALTVVFWPVVAVGLCVVAAYALLMLPAHLLGLATRWLLQQRAAERERVRAMAASAAEVRIQTNADRLEQ